MGDGVLSQDEINALLSGGVPDAPADGGGAPAGGGELSEQEIDTIGEIANISMGSAATTLFSLVNQIPSPPYLSAVTRLRRQPAL